MEARDENGGGTVLDLDCLFSIGVGSTAGVRLLDCSNAAELTTARKELASELLKADERLLEMHKADGVDESGVKKAALLRINVLLSKLVDVLSARRKAEEVPGTKGGQVQASKGNSSIGS